MMLYDDGDEKARKAKNEKAATEQGEQWTMYGSRTLRSAWVPFYDDGALACILEPTRVNLLADSARNPFLAPIASFD